ncbi:MAG: DUF2062 domain-containing protein [Thiolinea sp.]
MGNTLLHPNLWHFNRHSVSSAFAVGLFCMWIPFPPQTLIAALVAIILRVNLPLSVVLVYITNPVTIPPMFYAAYQLGARILHEEVHAVHFSLSVEWFRSTLDLIWQPLLLGCGITAILSAIIGYYGVQLFWRFHIIQKLKNRRANRQQRHKPPRRPPQQKSIQADKSK